ncbi:O-antigen ligase family protein [Crateriforma spongiae]|uniref:O-antigen ligase family protein n=1 Tax=Crateriforma spongiae TaxID=2724528 RepID=UPI0039B09FC5
MVKIVAGSQAALPIAYIIGVDSIIAHLVTTALILLFSMLSPRRVSAEVVYLAIFVGASLLISACVEIREETSLAGYIKYAAVLINLAGLLVVVERKYLTCYLNTYFLISVGFAVLHLGMILLGQIPDHYGRFTYFGGAHPNLGGEIYCVVIAFGAIACVNSRLFFFVSAVVLGCVFLMQARAALLVTISIVFLRAMLSLVPRIDARNVVAFSVILCSVSLLVLVEGSVVELFLDKAMLSNDVHRGMGTGFVGREERWRDAFEVFSSSPFTGVGLSYYDRSSERESPHNAILYGLALHGIFSLFFWGFLARSAYVAYNAKPEAVLILAPLVLLLLFNDRFLNLNPYPLLVYFAITKLSMNNICQQCRNSPGQVRQLANLA